MNDNNFEHTRLLTSVEHIWKYSLGVVRDIFKLFALEVQLAGRSLAIIIILAIVATLLLLSSWFSLLGALLTWIMTFHLSLIVGLLILSAINLIIAIAIGLYIVRISNNLHFKETRKQLEMMRE
ncbi:MAG: phage holin family protein [Gammaproteobacteria bacterium]|nr:phage holin family protein [Gammaproteobacteria bacterium]